MIRRIAAIAAAASLAAATSHAHFIWLEVAPEAPEVVLLRFSEEILEATPQDMQEKAAGMNVSTPAGAAIAMDYGEGAMHGKAPGDVRSIIGTLDYGVLDREEAGRGKFMLKYHARAAHDANAARSAVGLPVNVSAAIDGDTMTVTVDLDGKPVENAELVVTLPHELAAAEAVTDAEGKATFAVKSGDWVGVRAMVPETTSGKHKDQDYELVLHYSTLTFFHAEK